MRSLLLFLLMTAPALSLPPQLSHSADAVVSRQPLGAFPTPAGTTFRVFAPTAQSVDTDLYSPAGEHRRLELRKDPRDGTWSGTVPDDLTDWEYTYTAAGPNFGTPRAVVDPYAQLVTTARGRGVVVAPDSAGWTEKPTWPKHQAIIYELHLRDFTIDPDSGVQHPGTYVGLTESAHLPGHPDISTGLDHLVQLGVNTVQIMPPAQFLGDPDETSYGWGYDSVHFNSPERRYAVDPSRRLQEWKTMVNTLHARGLRVIVDMVWNHTMESRAHHQIFSFEGLVPGYYYRRKPDGSLYNGSGVGNEFRSEAPMARRFLLDSARHWLDDLHVDGFRLDLMGLVDRETMRQMAAAHPAALIYGEPWAAGETPLDITRKGDQRQQGYAVFNDDYRDALRGPVFHPAVGGFVQTGKGAAAVQAGLAGSTDNFAADPTESINYVECHDNHTLWDRLAVSAPLASEAEREAMDRLAALALISARGIPFLQSGQEFRRSKGGHDNTYNLGDAVNAVRWADKLRFRSLEQFYAGLIGLRRAHPMLSPAPGQAARQRTLFQPVPEGQVDCAWSDSTGQDAWAGARLLLNATAQVARFQLGPGPWQLYVDGSVASPGAPLRQIDTSEVELPPRCGWLLARPRRPQG